MSAAAACQIRDDLDGFGVKNEWCDEQGPTQGYQKKPQGPRYSAAASVLQQSQRADQMIGIRH